MAFIKTDPSQTKTVVGLLVILAVALVATVMRVHPGGTQAQQAVAAKTSQTSSTPAAASVKEVLPDVEPSRNPFRKPDSIKMSIGPEKKFSKDFTGAGGKPLGMLPPGANYKIDPMPVGAPASSSKTPQAAAEPQPKVEAPKPVFTLLATVGDARGLCAVIRSGGADAKVVEVGDVLDGGFKLVKVEESRAVLTDGRDTIIVTRPQS